MNNFKWPGDAECGVSLTYDDGLVSQTDNAIPDLNKFGIKGTFFLSGASLLDPDRHGPWKEAVTNGHEIGIHTIHHACDLKHEFVRKGFGLQDYSIDRMKRELLENINIVNSLGYKPDEYVFAYPCGESSLGPAMAESYKPLIREMFQAGRGVTAKYAQPGAVDLSETPCFEAPVTIDALISLVEKAKETSSWAVILFHGVGGDYIPVEKEVHLEFVKYLHENRKTIYTGTFGAAASMIKNHTIA